MRAFLAVETSELRARQADLLARYRELQQRRLTLDMTRGKPSPEQLALSEPLLDCADYRDAEDTDCRNYGLLEGLPSARRLFAEILDVLPQNVIVGGNSSLELMYNGIVDAILVGVPGGGAPWSTLPRVKFICPTPGYDRHFRICEHLNIEMISVGMRDDGPDVDAIERLVADDAAIKGMWCVPQYSNPTGVTVSADVVQRLAHMRPKAADFRIFWDNAYAVHHLTDDHTPLPRLLDACCAAGNTDRAYVFGSTSKITFAGGGVAFMASSDANVEHFRRAANVRSIGPDKLNQLRHVRFLRDRDGIRHHMRAHSALLKPKFDTVLDVFDSELGGTGIAEWSRPKGGYFLSFDTLPGCAGEVVRMAAEAGVKLTPAGSTFPYAKDPQDRNIRIAPSFPPLSDIRTSMEVVAIATLLVTNRNELARRAVDGL